MTMHVVVSHFESSIHLVLVEEAHGCHFQWFLHRQFLEPDILRYPSDIWNKLRNNNPIKRLRVKKPSTSALQIRETTNEVGSAQICWLNEGRGKLWGFDAKNSGLSNTQSTSYHHQAWDPRGKSGDDEQSHKCGFSLPSRKIPWSGTMIKNLHSLFSSFLGSRSAKYSCRKQFNCLQHTINEHLSTRPGFHAH